MKGNANKLLFINVFVILKSDCAAALADYDDANVMIMMSKIMMILTTAR